MAKITPKITLSEHKRRLAERNSDEQARRLARALEKEGFTFIMDGAVEMYGELLPDHCGMRGIDY
jgi:hypothetical protein